MPKLRSIVTSWRPAVGSARPAGRPRGAGPPYGDWSRFAPRAPLGRLIAPRRRVWGGWVAADAQAVVVRRSGHRDLLIPHATIRQVWLEGRNLALVADGGRSLYLPLLTLRHVTDRRFVRAVERAAGHRSSGAPVRRRALRRLLSR